MPRSPRQDFPGARHHVMNRTLRREAMFLDDATASLFLDALAEVPERFGARIHGYALMPNHYHLLIEVPRGNLSAVMKHVGQVFTQAFNRLHQHDGPVFRGRFHNRVVHDDTYWMHLLAYLHLNPVRAHLAARAEDCIWTSHNPYLDARQAPQWLTRSEMIGLFGSPAAIDAYVRDVQIKRRSGPDGFDPDRLWIPSSTASVEPPAPLPLRTPEQALEDVARVSGVPVEQVLTRKRGRSANRAAWLAIWWLMESTDLSQQAIGDFVGVSRARVSQLAGKLRRLVAEDEEVFGWQVALAKQIHPEI